MDSRDDGDVVVPSGTSTVQTFGVLSDSTRVDILSALWDHHDPTDPRPMSFSQLREAVGATDPGGFNYHLKKLTGQFVRKVDGGYELRDAGKRMARVLVSGAVGSNTSLDQTTVDSNCLFCEGRLSIRYADGWRYINCTECNARCIGSYPASLISMGELPPAGLVGRTPSEVYAADRIWDKHRTEMVMSQVCPECAGPMPVDHIDVCPNHDPDPHSEAVCDGCGSIFWGMVYHVCQVCKNLWKLPTLLYPVTHPAVVSFYYDHGLEANLASLEQRGITLDYDESVVSEDPLRIQIKIPLDDEVCTVTYDDQMRVVTVTR